MKQINNITPKGVHYIDDEGNPQFTDFATCQQNNIISMKQSEAQWTDDEEQFWQTAKYVGRRHALSDPPHLAFYTRPSILFEFPTRESLSKVLSRIKKAGWRTNDGD